MGPITLHALRVGEVWALTLGLSLSTFAVVARVYTKLRLTRNMKGEDYFSVLALLSSQIFIALAVTIGNNAGPPQHIAYLSVIQETVYSPIMVFVKTSILLQYVTLFVAHRGTIFHYAVHVLIWLNIIYYIINFFLNIFRCSPRERGWDPTVPGHCFTGFEIGVSSAAVNMASDFSIFILPLPVIYRLQMSWNKKIRYIAVFSVGLFPCITSIVRFVYSLELLEVAEVSPLYQLYIDRIGLWAYAEIATGVIVGCLPILPRFFKHCSSFKSRSFNAFKHLPSTVTQFARRRLLGRSTTRLPSDSKEAISPAGTDFLEKNNKEPKPGAAPHHIATLNITRCSLADLPLDPSPTRDNQRILQRGEDWVYGVSNVDDVEKAIAMADTTRSRLEMRKEAL